MPFLSCILSFWKKVIEFIGSVPAVVFVPVLAINGYMLYNYLTLILRLKFLAFITYGYVYHNFFFKHGRFVSNQLPQNVNACTNILIKST